MSGSEGKIVLVTGASGGLGAALASAFAGERYRVVITARSREKLQAVADGIARNGGQVLAIANDVTQRAQVKALAEEIRQRWGVVQILINNAGIARAASFSEM
ncbi:MAG TPA: SDR family NAD(P)-dependent oxidoreductase, partial [Candidatus Binatus sp.]|nr:SDR family NAD(P)-dependent oxidoreductase [Candidatus Binatus sp.]